MPILAQQHESLAQVREKESNMIMWTGIAIGAVLLIWILVRLSRRK
ncbi:MAG: hypothetical protein QM783_04660 [Phycisphaerales bacterium]